MRGAGMTRSHRPHQGMKTLVTAAGLLNAVALLLVATGLLSACASPVEGLWPASQGSATRAVVVSLDSWHAMIAFPRENGTEDVGLRTEKNSSGSEPQSSALGSQHVFEEWGYAERAWYLEDQRGLSGIVRALFWPTEGVVEVGHYDRVWADRTPQPPAERFAFRVSDEGFRRLRRHLRATIVVETPVGSVGPSTFYPAVRSYHLFHTCHQYAAHALREAGLPVSPFWAFNRTGLAWQLRRAARLIEEHQADLSAGGSRSMKSSSHPTEPAPVVSDPSGSARRGSGLRARQAPTSAIRAARWPGRSAGTALDFEVDSGLSGFHGLSFLMRQKYATARK